MIDSNAIDVIADDGSDSFATLKSSVDAGDLDLVWTHISVEELLRVADEDRRARLILTGIQLARLVPTSNLIADISRFDLASGTYLALTTTRMGSRHTAEDESARPATP